MNDKCWQYSLVIPCTLLFVFVLVDVLLLSDVLVVVVVLPPVMAQSSDPMGTQISWSVSLANCHPVVVVTADDPPIKAG